MLPTGYPYNLARLKVQWKTFVKRGVLSASELDPAIARSWLRCQKAGLDPTAIPNPSRYRTDELDHQRQNCFELIAIARPLMEDIYQFSGRSKMIVYLTDHNLHIIDMLGDPDLSGVLSETGLSEGTCLSEESIGTNAAALALAEGGPAQVVGPEHFFGVWHFITDTAAPIYAPEGEVKGMIGVITLERYSQPHTLGLVMAISRAIENQFQADAALAQAHHHLAVLNASLQAMRQGFILLDLKGTVTHINASAGEILGISPRTATGRPLSSLVQIPPELEESLNQRSPMKGKEITFVQGNTRHPAIVAVDILKEGLSQTGFVLVLNRVDEARELARTIMGARAHFTLDDISGWNPRMQQVIRYARAIARCDAPVLLVGEAGTGKGLFAQAIHNASHYAEGPFVAVDCASIPRELIAYELFGREKDSGVIQPGKFELAHGGTIFLQNIESLPLNFQAALLGVMDLKQVIRLGGTTPIPIKVRIIAASNVDLREEVRQKRFREDLYYRLRALTLTIPPLRERGKDIVFLATQIVEQHARRRGKQIVITPRALAALEAYRWPGNVRELENVLEWAVQMVEGNELDIVHLPEEVRRAARGSSDESVPTLLDMERQAILRAGMACQGNVTEMARVLGIGRTTLWRKMRAFGLKPETFKSAQIAH